MPEIITLVTPPPLPFDAAVISPFPFTVMFAFVKEPTFELTVASVVTKPELVMSPDSAPMESVSTFEAFVFSIKPLAEAAGRRIS